MWITNLFSLMQCRLWTFLCLGPRHHKCYAWRSLGPSWCSNFTLSLVHFPTDELAVLLAARWYWVLKLLKQDVLEAIMYCFLFLNTDWCNRKFCRNSASNLGFCLKCLGFISVLIWPTRQGTHQNFGFPSWCRCVDTLDCFRQIIWNISVPNQSSCLGFKSSLFRETNG